MHNLRVQGSLLCESDAHREVEEEKHQEDRSLCKGPEHRARGMFSGKEAVRARDRAERAGASQLPRAVL